MTFGFTRPAPVAHRFAVPAAAALLSLAGAPAALAHDAVVGGSPADGAVVTEFPRTLELTFSGEVQDGFNTFALSNAGTGQVIYSGEPHLDGRNVILDLPSDITGEPGDYRIGFQIISSDGHSTKGMTTFTYRPEGGNASETPSTSGAPAPESGGDGGSRALPFVVGGLAVLAAAGAVIAMAGRRGKRGGS